MSIRYYGCWLVVLAFCLVQCAPATETTAEEVAVEETETVVEAEEPMTAEAAEINDVVTRVYAAISFPEGTTPDYAGLRSHFTDDAVFQHYRFDSLTTRTLDEFMAGFQNSVDAGRMTGFREEELGGVTESFGRIGHRISAYGSYVNGSTEMVERGVNSFQLLKLPEGWRVSAVIWDVEEEGLPIPARYLE